MSRVEGTPSIWLLALLLVGTQAACPTLPENVAHPLQYNASMLQYTIETGLEGQPRLAVNGCVNLYVSRTPYSFEVSFECCSEPRIPCNDSHFTYVTDMAHQWNPRLSLKVSRHLGFVICWIGGYFQTVGKLNGSCADTMEGGATCRKMATGKSFATLSGVAANFKLDTENRADETRGQLFLVILVGLSVVVMA